MQSYWCDIKANTDGASTFFSFYCAIIMCILLYVRPCAFSQLNADARKKFEFFASGFICAPSKFWVLLFLPWPGSCKCQSLLAIFLILHVYELGFIEAIVKEFCCLIFFLLVLIYLHMSCCISVGSICKEESRPANWEPWIRPCWIRGPSLCFWTLYLLEALLFII